MPCGLPIFPSNASVPAKTVPSVTSAGAAPTWTATAAATATSCSPRSGAPSSIRASTLRQTSQTPIDRGACVTRLRVSWACFAFSG